MYCPAKRYGTYFSFKLCENRSYGSEVTLSIPNPRWQPPPSWFMSRCQIRLNLHVAHNTVYLSFKFFENRSNGSEVTVLFLNSRWQPKGREGKEEFELAFHPLGENGVE